MPKDLSRQKDIEQGIIKVANDVIDRLSRHHQKPVAFVWDLAMPMALPIRMAAPAIVMRLPLSQLLNENC